MKVYEAVAAALAAERCGTVFGLLGDRIMGLWSALAANREVEIVSARHEAAAVCMADGHARLAGIGVAAVTSGPALTHTATPLVAAARGRSPIVILAGDVPEHDLYNSQQLDQRRFAEACEAHVETLASPAKVAATVRRAFHVARTQRRPVVLNMPLDVQGAEVAGAWHYVPSTEFIQNRRRPADAEDIALLADALAAARRPVLVAGRGTIASGAEGAIVEIANRVGALLATSLPAKGLFCGHPYDIGICGGFASAPGQRLLAEADLVVGFGAELGHYTLGEDSIPFPEARLIRIDAAPPASDPGALPADHFVGDAGLTAALVLQDLEQRQVRREGYRSPATDAALRWTPPPRRAPEDGIDPRAMMEALSPALPDDIQVVVGAGHFWSWPINYLSLPRGCHIQFTYPFGAIGSGLPLAIGVATASPSRPHVLIEGDGSLMQNLQELDTAVGRGLQIVVIVMNDGGFGAEIHKMDAKGLDSGLARNRSPDFVAIARAMGGDGVRLEDAADIAAAVRTGIEAGGLYLIDAPLSPTTPSDRYERMYHGKENLSPLLRPAGAPSR